LTQAVITPQSKKINARPYIGADKTFGRGFEHIKVNIQYLILFTSLNVVLLFCVTFN